MAGVALCWERLVCYNCEGEPLKCRNALYSAAAC